MNYRIEISPTSESFQLKDANLSRKAKDYLNYETDFFATRQVLTVQANISKNESQKIAKEIVNPVIQKGLVGHSQITDFDWYISVGFLPGVTDNIGKSAKEAINDIIGRQLTDSEHVFSSTEYFLKNSKHLQYEDVKTLTAGLLANKLINNINILTNKEIETNGFPENNPLIQDATKPVVKILNLDLNDDELLQISKEGTLALTLEEMQCIKNYTLNHYIKEQRDFLNLSGVITDAELEILAQTWSEHCKHKIFAAKIDYKDENGNLETIDSLYKTFIQKSTKEIGENIDWLVSVFHDNAGVVSFNDKYDLVYKAETHNSPSALDPYGGSMTGIVGVNRDPLGTGIGAELLINVWGYCLGSPFSEKSEVPEGLLHPRRLRDQIHKGVIDGGNQSGVPYGYGWEYFDKRYIGKPLVYCGTVGLLPREIHGQSGANKTIEPGDRIVMVGGRIGKDGIHGATFSSEELHSESPVQAVQIGDPITQKKMADFIIEARNLGLYRFITDNGAGGLSSSIGEMATKSGGCKMDLAKAPTKYNGLQPWEIIISEAQERMSLAVPPEKMRELAELAKQRDVEISDLGEFNNSGIFHLTFNDDIVCFLNMEFLHDGLPQLHLNAQWTPVEKAVNTPECNIAEDLNSLLQSLNITSNETKARQYDHEVKGLSVVKPFTGVQNDIVSDATVFMPEQLSQEGIILSAAIAPSYSDIDTYHMMASIIDQAIRKIIAVGGKLGGIAGLDNFCWPDPVESTKTPDGQYKLAQLVRANKGLYDYCKAFSVPCVSGKDSMKNDSSLGGKKISIPPTVLFSAISKLDDISKSVTISAKKAGDRVYVAGMTKNEMGGSQYSILKNIENGFVPKVDADSAISLYDAISKATNQELCHSLHTPTFGGLAVAFAKTALAGNLGLEINLEQIPSIEELSLAQLLFSESNSRFVITVPEDKSVIFEKLMISQPIAFVGVVIEEKSLKFSRNSEVLEKLALDELRNSYKKTLANL